MHALRTALGFTIVAALGAGCFPREQGEPSGTGNGTGDASSEGGDDSEESDDNEGSDDNDAEAGSEASGAEESSGAEPIDLGPCSRLLACVETQDVPITELIRAYGPDGTCWQEFEQEACWQDCRAVQGGFESSCGSTPACCECEADPDCAHQSSDAVCFEGACVEVGTGTEGPGCLALLECPPDTIEIEILQSYCGGIDICAAQLDALAFCALQTGGEQALCEDLTSCLNPGSCLLASSCPDEVAALEACAF